MYILVYIYMQMLNLTKTKRKSQSENALKCVRGILCKWKTKNSSQVKINYRKI